MLCPQPMSVSITAVALLDGRININKTSQHLPRQSSVYKIQAENGQGQNKHQYSIVGCFVWRKKGLTTLESRFHFPMENFSIPSNWDKPSKAIRNPIELNRNGTWRENGVLPAVNSRSKGDCRLQILLEISQFFFHGRLSQWCCKDC